MLEKFTNAMSRALSPEPVEQEEEITTDKIAEIKDKIEKLKLQQEYNELKLSHQHQARLNNQKLEAIDAANKVKLCVDGHRERLEAYLKVNSEGKIFDARYGLTFTKICNDYFNETKIYDAMIQLQLKDAVRDDHYQWKMKLEPETFKSVEDIKQINHKNRLRQGLLDVINPWYMFWTKDTYKINDLNNGAPYTYPERPNFYKYATMVTSAVILGTTAYYITSRVFGSLINTSTIHHVPRALPPPISIDTNLSLLQPTTQTLFGKICTGISDGMLRMSNNIRDMNTFKL